MATGAHHTCAVLTSGSANCWGYSNYGQLGTGDTTNRYSPATVSGLGSGMIVNCSRPRHFKYWDVCLVPLQVTWGWVRACALMNRVRGRARRGREYQVGTLPDFLLAMLHPTQHIRPGSETPNDLARSS